MSIKKAIKIIDEALDNCIHTKGDNPTNCRPANCGCEICQVYNLLTKIKAELQRRHNKLPDAPKKKK